jgi:hypothetical protein
MGNLNSVALTDQTIREPNRNSKHIAGQTAILKNIVHFMVANFKAKLIDCTNFDSCRLMQSSIDEEDRFLFSNECDVFIVVIKYTYAHYTLQRTVRYLSVVTIDNADFASLPINAKLAVFNLGVGNCYLDSNKSEIHVAVNASENLSHTKVMSTRSADLTAEFALQTTEPFASEHAIAK